MADNRVVAEIVTDFFLNTCELRRRLNMDALAVLINSSHTVQRGAEFDDDVDATTLSTGSARELYIEPMLSCVGDVDIMIHWSSVLAIPQGHPPPTQLPDEFHGQVHVFEIIDTGFPGYVYLVLCYLLTEIADDGRYNVVQCPHQYVNHGLTLKKDGDSQGPAIVRKHPHHKGPKSSDVRLLSFFASGSLLSSDTVPCVRCLSWPIQAADWPIRPKNHGWPDSATVDRVVSSGCDVVMVAHRLCRQDEWMRNRQCRLSFSRAEITLLNSWVKVQQIVYHMLRFFMKTEGLTDIRDSTGSKILSNYNTKTLMLWACEKKGRSWWIDDLNVVGICVELLHILADCLTDTCCPHYFVNNGNLFDSLDNSQLTQNMARRLQSVTETWLAEWFVNKYIRKCARDPSLDSEVSRLFDDISTHANLQNAVSALVNWRLGATLLCSLCQFSAAQHTILSLQYLHPGLRASLYFMRELPKVDERLSVYFTAVKFLNVAFKINRNPLTDEMLDILSTVCLQSNDVRRCLNARHSSTLSLGRAAKLMKVIANNSHSAVHVQLIEIELSKAYLYRALRCKDSDSDSIYCLANVYLAVLYCIGGQYQLAMDHCAMVMRSRDHSQCSLHVVQGELMPQVDFYIDTVLGLAVFYQYVRTAALNQQQRAQYVSVFSTELLAHYLHIRCQPVVKCRQFTQMSSSADVVQRYVKCFSEASQIFVTDLMVFHSVCRAKYSANGEKPVSSRERTNPATSGQLDTSRLVELLQWSAVEHLTTFRQLEARDIGSVDTIVTTDFDALYAYKDGEYQCCLPMSTQNVHTLIGGVRMSHVFACSELIQLMDDDLVCLIGLTLLVDPTCRQEPKHVAISQLILSLYLMTQCQMKLHHSVTSMAETLDYIEVARHKPSEIRTLDSLLLKLTEHKILRYVSVDR